MEGERRGNGRGRGGGFRLGSDWQRGRVLASGVGRLGRASDFGCSGHGAARGRPEARARRAAWAVSWALGRMSRGGMVAGVGALAPGISWRGRAMKGLVSRAGARRGPARGGRLQAAPGVGCTARSAAGWCGRGEASGAARGWEKGEEGGNRGGRVGWRRLQPLAAASKGRQGAAA
jgi:hypothetical protein